MRTNNSELLDLISQPTLRFVIPSYQRTYAWEERQLQQFWDDVMRAGTLKKKHFFGTLLYGLEEPSSQKGKGSEEMVAAVVDGQQRLTTTLLLILALAEHLDQHPDALGNVSADDLRTAYLFVESGTKFGEEQSASSAAVKLQLSRDDGPIFAAMVTGGPDPQDPSLRLHENLQFFKDKMAEASFDPEALFEGLRHLYVIEATVEKGDHAQLIFESLNSKGMPLTTADLVRNYLLIAKSHQEQMHLYEEYWKPTQGLFVPDPGSKRLDNAIQGWLSIRFRKVRAHGADEVYDVFKRYVEEEYTGTTEDLLRELRSFSLVWAENYRYHAVKKYRSAYSWAQMGPQTLVSHYEKKPPTNQAHARQLSSQNDAVDASL